MTAGQQVSVPVGVHAPRWLSVPVQRTVVLIVHNVTTLNRLLDVLPVFDNDSRIQIVLTDAEADPFHDGLIDALARTGLIVIPWSQARQTRFDLAISASHHGELADIQGPRAILSHGIGYTKYPPRRPETGDRRPETGDRRPETGDRRPETGAFGLSDEWLLSGGQPVADAFILSHAAQREVVAARVPAALESTVVAGDPCYDRLAASMPMRQRYRAGLRVGDRTLVVLTSTWSGESLLGVRPELPRELLAELSPDAFLVALVLHPNITHGQGAGAVRGWYADCLRAGMLILDEVDGWRAGLIAADVVIGDHGSVTGYAAALGIPTLLGAFTEVPSVTPISVLGQLASRLPAHGPYAPAITQALEAGSATLSSQVRELTTSEPGLALTRLRATFYRLLRLAEPATEITAAPVPVCVVADDIRPHAHLVYHQVDAAGRVVSLTRGPAEVQRPQRGVRRIPMSDSHLNCSIDYPNRSLLAEAAALCAQPEDTGNQPDRWHASVFDNQPACLISAVLNGQTASVHTRDGDVLVVTAPGVPAELLASVVYAWLAADHDLAELAPNVVLDLDGHEHTVVVRLDTPSNA